MTYQIKPILFKGIMNKIIKNNITNYYNKRDADTLLLNSGSSDSNEDILKRIEEYTTNIEKLKNFMNKLNSFYGKALDDGYNTSFFLKEILKQTASDYNDDSITIDTFYSDYVMLTIEEYLKMRAQETSSIKASTKVFTMLVSRTGNFSFSGSEASSAYTVISQNPQVFTVEKDPKNPWNIIVHGIMEGSSNVVIEDKNNNLSITVPCIIQPSTLVVPTYLQVKETKKIKFSVSSNIDPIHVSGLRLKDGIYVEDTSKNPITHEIEHPYDGVILSRVDDEITVYGDKPKTVKFNVSIYDKTHLVTVNVLPAVLNCSASSINARKGKRNILNIYTDVELKYEVNDIVNSDNLNITLTRIDEKNYSMAVVGRNTGHSVIVLKAGTQRYAVDTWITATT